ncbi:Outer membrane protein assembly factor BamB [Candidatus Gugararchaeum adminiculabundum]|nr:Outer membrane protein assembly factor BamB [Candidatus Gugararchaeum adminiculabundum]
MRRLFLIVFFALILSTAVFAAFKWQYSTGGPVYSSPVVSDGVVFFGSDDGNVYALEAQTGLVGWTFAANGSVRAAPLVLKNTLVIGSDDGKVYALDVKNGGKRWIFQAGGPVRCQVALGSEAVFAGSLDGKLYAIFMGSGKEAWNYSAGNPIQSSPLFDEGKVYFADSEGNFYTLSASDGRMLSNITIGPVVGSSPVNYGKYILVGSLDGYVYAIEKDTGKIAWKFDAGDWVQSTPLVKDGIAYFGSNGHYVYAIDAADGMLKWKTKTGGAMISSPKIALSEGGKSILYIGSDDTKLYAFNAEDGALLWSTPAGDWIRTTPETYDNYVLIGSADGSVSAASTISCSFMKPAPMEPVGAWVTGFRGIAFAGPGVEKVSIRVGGGQWIDANGKDQWDGELDLSNEANGIVRIDCMVTDANGREENAPYQSLMVNKTDAAKMKKMYANIPTSLAPGESFSLQAWSDEGLLKNFKAKVNGEEKTGDNLTFSYKGSAESISVEVSKSGYETIAQSIRIRQAGGIPLPVPVIIGIAVIGLGVLAYFKFVKKKKK